MASAEIRNDDALGVAATRRLTLAEFFGFYVLLFLERRCESKCSCIFLAVYIICGYRGRINENPLLKKMVNSVIDHCMTMIFPKENYQGLLRMQDVFFSIQNRIKLIDVKVTLACIRREHLTSDPTESCI
jgi:hypothetical protein